MSLLHHPIRLSIYVLCVYDMYLLRLPIRLARTCVSGVRELDKRLARDGRTYPSEQAPAAQQDTRRLEVRAEVVPASGLPAFHRGLVSPQFTLGSGAPLPDTFA